VSQAASAAEDKRCKQLTRPIQQSEKSSGSNLTTAAAFFAPKQTKKATTITTQRTMTQPMTQSQKLLSPVDLCGAAMERVNNAKFNFKKSTRQKERLWPCEHLQKM